MGNADGLSIKESIEAEQLESEMEYFDPAEQDGQDDIVINLPD